MYLPLIENNHSHNKIWMNKIRVLLADNQFLFLQSLHALLKTHSTLEVVGTVQDGNHCSDMIAELKPDILISDIELPKKSVFEIAIETRKQSLPTKIIVFSKHQSEMYIKLSIKHGIHGFVSKKESIDEIVYAVQEVYRGDLCYSRVISKAIIQSLMYDPVSCNSYVEKLSNRELEILKLLTEGMKSDQIAKRLHLSSRTVSNHRANMIKKTGAKNTIELIVYYLDYLKYWD